MNQAISREEARRTHEAMIRAIPEPAFTPTWHPHSHAKVLDATAEACDKLGLKVGKKTYSLSSGGDRMHFLWEVDEAIGKKFCIGGRNSLDKMLSVAYTSVLTILVCTNQITHANWFQVRRHTAGLTVAQLGDVAMIAIQRVVDDFRVTDAWHEGLKSYALEQNVIEQLTVKAMRVGILPPSKFPQFDELLFGSADIEPVYESNLYGVHGALTQLIRNHNLETIAYENKQITAFIDAARKDS